MGGARTKDKLKLLSRLMQACILVVAAAGIITHNLTWVPAALVSLFVTMIPSFVRRDIGFVLPPELSFWVVAALFLHVVGGYAGFYNSLPGWDHLTHVMSASLIGALGFVLVVTVDKYVESIYLPRTFLAVFIVMFTMAVGVLWEIMEFANDSLTHSHLQYGLSDTMYDLMFDGFAGIVVAFAGARYLTHMSTDHFVESLRIEDAKARLREYVGRRKRIM